MISATHSVWGALITPGLVVLLVGPAVVARVFFGWGDAS